MKKRNIKSRMSKKQIELNEAIARKRETQEKIDRKIKESKRRMSRKQLEKVITELGVGSTVTIPTFDSIYNYRNIPYQDGPAVEQDEGDKVVNRILGSLGTSYGNWSVLEKYNKMIGGKRLGFKDKLNTLAYLTNISKNIPFYLVPKKEKQKGARKIGLKTKGDIRNTPFLLLNHPSRISPDDEFLRETGGIKEKRTKFDRFDKMAKDKQINWARYASSVISLRTDGNIYRNRDSFNVAPLAMKYACKMVGIPVFSGIFSNPYWIIYRTEKYFGLMTDKEYKVMFALLFDYVGVRKKKTLPIVKTKEAVSKLIPTLRNMKLLGKFNKAKKILHKKDFSNTGAPELDLAKKLILGQEVEINKEK
jgi:hypothetical protein